MGHQVDSAFLYWPPSQYLVGQWQMQVKAYFTEEALSALFTGLLPGQGEPLTAGADLHTLCIIHRDILVHLVNNVTKDALLVQGLDPGDDASISWLELACGIMWKNLQYGVAAEEVWVARGIVYEEQDVCLLLLIYCLTSSGFLKLYTSISSLVVLTVMTCPVCFISFEEVGQANGQ